MHLYTYGRRTGEMEVEGDRDMMSSSIGARLIEIEQTNERLMQLAKSRYYASDDEYSLFPRLSTVQHPGRILIQHALQESVE